MKYIYAELPKNNVRIFNLENKSLTIHKTALNNASFKISRNFTGNASVYFYVEGAKAQSENWGIGKDFDGSGEWFNAGYEKNYTIVQFSNTEKEKTVSLSFVDNKVVELDKSLKIYLANPSTGKIYPVTSNITIIDDRLASGTYINATSPPGGLQPLTGSGDESSKLTAMVNYILSHGNGKGLIYIPSGTYNVKQIEFQPHVSFIGSSANPPIFKAVVPNPISTSVSLSAATKCRVTCNNHGLATGDYVYFTDTTQSDWYDLENWMYYVVKVDNNNFDLLRLVSALTYYGEAIRPWGALYQVRTATRGNPTPITVNLMGNTNYGHPFQVGDYVYFNGLTAPWDVLNGNHYQIVSVDYTNKRFSIDFDSSGLSGNGSWDSTSIWCGVTFDSSAKTSWQGTTQLRRRITAEDDKTFVFKKFNVSSDWTDTPAAMKNLVVDGNLYYVGPSTYYQNEQFAAIPLMTSSYAVALRAENIKVQNTAGDGFKLSNNTKTRFYKHTYDRCFRGSVTINYSPFEAQIKDIEAGGTSQINSCFHMELSNPASGGNLECHGYRNQMSGFLISNGSGTNPATVSCRNIQCGSLLISGPNATINIEDSEFTCRDYEAHIFYQSNVTIKNTTFKMRQVDPAANVYLLMANFANGTVTFDTCNWQAVNALTGSLKACVYFNAQAVTQVMETTFKNCHFGSGFPHGVNLYRGARLRFENCTSDADYIVRLVGSYVSGYDYKAYCTMIGCVPGAGKRYMSISPTSSVNYIIISHPLDGSGDPQTVLTPEQATYVVESPSYFNNISFSGARLIVGTGNPSSSINGMPGDIYLNSATGERWYVASYNDAGYTRTDNTIKQTVWTKQN